MSRIKKGDRVFINHRTISTYAGTDRVGTEGVVSMVAFYADLAVYEIDHTSGFYAEADLELATNKGTNMESTKAIKRAFKLLVETPSTYCGAIYEERDGYATDYILQNKDTHYKGKTWQDVGAERFLVEDNPKWFAEVFPVTPQYMTREELDQFEAFKRTMRLKALVSKGRSTVAVDWRAGGLVVVKPKKTRKAHAPRTAESLEKQSATMKAYWSLRKAEYLEGNSSVNLVE